MLSYGIVLYTANKRFTVVYLSDVHYAKSVVRRCVNYVARYCIILYISEYFVYTLHDKRHYTFEVRGNDIIHLCILHTMLRFATVIIKPGDVGKKIEIFNV